MKDLWTCGLNNLTDIFWHESVRCRCASLNDLVLLGTNHYGVTGCAV